MLGKAVVQHPCVAHEPVIGQLHVPRFDDGVKESHRDDLPAEDVVDHLFGVNSAARSRFEFLNPACEDQRAFPVPVEGFGQFRPDVKVFVCFLRRMISSPLTAVLSQAKTRTPA